MRAWALIVIVCVAVLAAGSRVAAAQQSGSSSLVPSVPWLAGTAPSRGPSHPATLPDTGDDVVWQLIAGAALVGGGVAALRVRRR